jgi:hypothetical protein
LREKVVNESVFPRFNLRMEVYSFYQIDEIYNVDFNRVAEKIKP